MAAVKKAVLLINYAELKRERAHEGKHVFSCLHGDTPKWVKCYECTVETLFVF